MVKLGGNCKPLLTPSPPYFGPLTVSCFITYLGFRDYKIDFELNFLFSLTKRSCGYYAFQSILSIFENQLRGLDRGLLNYKIDLNY